MAYAAVFAVAISHLAGALHLWGDPGHLGAYSTDQLSTSALLEIGAFHDAWDIALVLFGVHLVLVGYLCWTSGQAPRVIGVLLVVAGLGHLLDSLGSLLLADYALSVGAFTFGGEVLLRIWLLVRGGHRRHPDDAAAHPTLSSESVR